MAKWTPTKKQLEEYNKKREEVLELSKSSITDIFENYQTDIETVLDYFIFASKFYNYSPNNVALIQAQLPNSTFVQSSGAWHSMGAVPKKGTHGAKILVPQKKKFIIADKDTVLKYQDLNDKQKEKIISNPAEKVVIALSQACKEIKIMAKNGEFDTKEKLVYGLGSVFDIAQTTYPVEDYPKLFTVGIPDEKAHFMYNAISSYINEKTPYSISEKEIDSISLHGFFSPLTNQICINNILQDSEKIKTMLHELGHAFYHNLEAQKENNQSNVLPLRGATEMKEIQADIFATLSLSMYDFELPDSLKEHLKNNYTSLSNKLRGTKTDEQITKIIESSSTDVMKEFNKHAKAMNEYIEEYTLEQSQTIETTEEISETIENYDEESDEINMSF